MKWNEDLVEDIRRGNDYDDQDGDGEIAKDVIKDTPYYEFSECNRKALTDKFLSIKDSCKVIVEIGVCRNGDQSSTFCFLNNKNDDTIYIGIDLEDKTYLDDTEKNIFTIQGDSGSVEEAFEIFKDLGVTNIDFLFIDGLHSINQVLMDWEYTRLLSPTGVVGFHDTTGHPGPYYFIKALNKDIWDVEENVCCTDNGIGFASKKIKE